MDLGILPPDDQTFVKNKKSTSDRQKAHLENARKKKLEKKNEFVNNPVVEENEEEDLGENETEVQEEEPKQSKKKVVKPREKKENPKSKSKYQLTEEEIQERIDLEKFEKFMKHMSKYEAVKKKIQEEEEDKKKIHVKYTQDEYDELLGILDRDDKNLKQNIKNPVAPKQVEKDVIKYNTPPLINNSISRTRYGTRNRFGRGM
jgi:uncharacterized protein (DUF885 family)